MYADLFKGASTVTIEVPLLKETLRDAKPLIEEQKWSEQEGLQIIFANGLYYLRGERQLQHLPARTDGLAAEVERLTTELMDMHSKYAVMKFRAYTLNEAKQALEFNVTGLETENRWSTARLWQFRADEEQMQKELEALHAENRRLRQRLAELEAPEAEPTTQRRRQPLLARILNVFRR
jgi:cell division protein FtsB